MTYLRFPDTTTQPTEHTLQSAAADRDMRTDAQVAYALAMTMRTDLNHEALLIMGPQSHPQTIGTTMGGIAWP